MQILVTGVFRRRYRLRVVSFSSKMEERVKDLSTREIALREERRHVK